MSESRLVKSCLVVLALAAVGCGHGAEGAARTTLATGARVVVELDRANAARMAETRAADLEAAETREAFDATRAPYWRVEEAIRAADGILRASEAVLDATGMEGLRAIAGCTLQAIGHLVDAAEAAGIRAPPEVQTVLGFLAATADDECTRGES